MTQTAIRPAADKTPSGAVSGLPLVAFIAVFFVRRSGAMLWRSVDNPVPAQLLPRTAAVLADWVAKRDTRRGRLRRRWCRTSIPAREGRCRPARRRAQFRIRRAQFPDPQDRARGAEADRALADSLAKLDPLWAKQATMGRDQGRHHRADLQDYSPRRSPLRAGHVGRQAPENERISM